MKQGLNSEPEEICYGIKENRTTVFPSVKVYFKSSPEMGFAKEDYSLGDSIDFNLFYLKKDSLCSFKNYISKKEWDFKEEQNAQCTYSLKVFDEDFK